MISTAIEKTLLDLLTKWNLKHLHTHFNEHRITTDVLKILNPDHIKTLFHGLAVGDQALFEKNLQSWRKNSTSFAITSPTPSICEQKKTAVSVLTMLQNTSNGKSILKYYKVNKILHEEQRQLLIRTIASYVESEGIASSLSDCKAMEKEICSIFPTEELEYYNNGKRGKIYSKIYNLKRLSRQILQPTEEEEEEERECRDEYVVDAEAKLAAENLRIKGITADEFDMYWRKCSQYRFQQMLECKSSSDFLNKWPEYLRPSGFQLIDIDFSLKYKNVKEMIPRWDSYYDKILQLLTRKISNSYISRELKNLTSCSPESKTFGILWYLHHLFPPQTKVLMDDSGAKIRKKYSVQDSQESFAIIANSKQELEMKIDLLKFQKSHTQPRLLIIGSVSDNENQTNISSDETSEEFLENSPIDEDSQHQEFSTYKNDDEIDDEDNDAILDLDESNENNEDDNTTSGRMKHKCQYCLRVFKYLGCLHKHKAQVHNENYHTQLKYKCKVCNRGFTTLKSLKRHVLLHDKSNILKCPVCPAKKMKLHMFLKHVMKHESDKCFPCQACGKVYDSNEERLTHWQTHSKEKPYACNECYRRFSQEHYLTVHLKIHGQYSCYFCPQQFVSTRTLQIPYICPNCEKLQDIYKAKNLT